MLTIGSQWVYEAFKNKYRMLFFTGDVDGCVPAKGTLRWIETMNRQVLEYWRPFFVDSKLAGTVQVYEGLTLGIIHGSGHMTPMYKPKEAYHLVLNWLEHKSI